ncbi:helix-turn-helix domain-containing protein [Candidatus Borrarchaeum sp.]|uniref:helix-turn-helix domain-containing protein n=1 Tax=Candidatus Borrarchaeum sp. TaxID=2846742 RepID=UPI00257C7F62|nr:helix-turn-helix domain-containing protein [Candidatus Borrarchaeum sp.]
MEILTTTVPETYYKECCTECGSSLVNFRNMELVCEHCGIVAEDRPFDFNETRTNYKWRQKDKDKKLSFNKKPVSIQSYMKYRILHKKIKRSYQRDAREKLFTSEIARICAQLELPSVILRDAEQYSKKILQEIPQYTHLDSIMAAATALVWGVSFIYSPRTLQEIMSVTHPLVSRSKVLQAANRIVFTQLVKSSPRMLENKQFINLVNYYLEHFGAVLGIPFNVILTAKGLFKRLGYKKYIIKPDVQSVALLLYAWTKESTTEEFISLNKCPNSQNQNKEKNRRVLPLDEIKENIRSFSGYEKGYGLRCQILQLLYDQGRLSVKTIADQLQKSYHSVYYHIQKLKELGLLSEEKRKNMKDQKKPRIVFTIKAQKLIENATQIDSETKLSDREDVKDTLSKPNLSQLNWERITRDCYISKTSARKVIRAIQKDIKKEMSAILFN